MTTVRAFRDAVQAAAQRLGDYPLLGRLQPELLPPPYQFWSLPRFQVVLVYNASATPPRILRLLSTARDFAPLLAGIVELSDKPSPL